MFSLWPHIGLAKAQQLRPTEKLCTWFWRELKRLNYTIGDEISGKDGKRKVPGHANPGISGRLAITETSNAALQVLNSGEIAAPHRRFMSVIHLITNENLLMFTQTGWRPVGGPIGREAQRRPWYVHQADRAQT